VVNLLILSIFRFFLKKSVNVVSNASMEFCGYLRVFGCNLSNKIQESPDIKNTTQNIICHIANVCFLRKHLIEVGQNMFWLCEITSIVVILMLFCYFFCRQKQKKCASLVSCKLQKLVSGPPKVCFTIILIFCKARLTSFSFLDNLLLHWF